MKESAIMPFTDIKRLAGKHIRYMYKWPLLLPRVAANYAELLLLKRPRLRAVEFAVTYRCNAACKHCSAVGLEDKSRKELGAGEIIRIAAEARKLGALNINYTGGEALLRDDLEEIIAASRPESTVVSVATNGKLFTAKRAEGLARAGLKIVSISLDSRVPSEHDDFRGTRGMFRAALQAVEIAKGFGIEPFLCTTVTSKSINNGGTRALIDLADRLDVTITLQTACPVGNWAEENEQLLAPRDRGIFYKLTRLPHVRWEGISNYLKEGCPAAVEKLAITPYGEVMPCVFFHVSYGNLREESLQSIWTRMLQKGPFYKIRKGCPVAEDPDFREKWLPPGRDSIHKPVPIDELEAFDD
ncbi:MAG: radical SAM protein [Deltaproteobacteria bacterium]|nr:radical SAM protein [Deltaproteobacteria bacterium]